MPRRVIDLSAAALRESQVHPFFTSPQIMRHIDSRPTTPEDQPSFNAELIITSNHAATHVDAFGHYDCRRAPRRSARCRSTPSAARRCASTSASTAARATVTPDEIQEALWQGGSELATGDILLFCTDHYNQTAGTPAFLDGFSGSRAGDRRLDGASAG